MFDLNKEIKEEDGVLLSSKDMEDEKSGSSDKMIEENSSVTPSKSEDHHKKPK